MPVSTTDRSQLNDNNNDFPFHDPVTDVVDCNVAKVSEGVGYSTNVKLNSKTARAEAHQAYGPTGNVFAEAVFKARGMVPQVDYQILWSVPTSTIRELLRAGWYVTVYVDYGVLNSLDAATSGDRNYKGYHAIGMHGLFRGSQGLSTHKHDPLNDGRKASIQQGIVTVKFSHIRDAAYAYTKKPGFIQGWAVKPK